MGIQVGLMREMARSFQGTRVYDFGCLYGCYEDHQYFLHSPHEIESWKLPLLPLNDYWSVKISMPLIAKLLKLRLAWIWKTWKIVFNQPVQCSTNSMESFPAIRRLWISSSSHLLSRGIYKPFLESKSRHGKDPISTEVAKLTKRVPWAIPWLSLRFRHLCPGWNLYQSQCSQDAFRARAGLLKLRWTISLDEIT